jgi:hypothetical protein
MNKRVYQQPTMNVVKIQQKSHILSGSLRGVSSNAEGLHYGGGASVDANSRRGGGWDDEE